jgi:hypothetical protein
MIGTIVADLGTLIARTNGGGTYTVLNEDLVALHTLENRRLRDFYDRVGTLLLPVCACSPIFRAHLSQADPAIDDELDWAIIARLIADNVHSLELFAQTRQLAWQEAMNDF